MSATGPTVRAVRVLDTGPLVTVQDPGRPGLAHLGVARSGWLDAPAARLANRLVGNAEGAAVLEVLLGGASLEVTEAMAVSVTGAPCRVSVDGRPVPHHAAVALAAGQTLALGPPTEGLRCYVALAGGLAVTPVLGSRATDTLSGLGPAPVEPGALLPVGTAVGEPSGAEAVPASRSSVLGCSPGPRADWFTGAALETLTTSTYTVQPDSDRIGLRLAGPALERARAGELPSEGVVLGAVQVPPDGQPLVFLADHPVTGGYPVVAVVDPPALARCAQLRPGEEVRFSLRAPRPSAGPG